MDQKELLKRIKKENESMQDPYEAEVDSNGWGLGVVCAAVLAALMCLWQALAWGEYNVALFASLLAEAAIAYTFRAVKLKKPRHIICAVIFDVAFLASLTVFILMYVGGRF